MNGVGARVADLPQDRRAERSLDRHRERRDERRDERRALTAPARRLLADVTRNPRGPLVAAVSGPAGTGKTDLLDALAEVYQAAGLTIHREPGQLVRPGAVLLVDDAHALAEDNLTALAEFAGRDAAHLVVAYRPWPVSRPLAELARTRPEVRLGRLSADEVTALATTTLGNAPEPDLVTEIVGLTGGLPTLVDRAVEALRAAGRLGAAGLDWVLGELDRLPMRVRDVLLALSVARDAGSDGDVPEVDVLTELLDADEGAVTEALKCAWSAGLVDDAGRAIGLAVRATTSVTSAITRRDVKRRIADIQLARGGPVLATGRLLLDVGARGSRAAAALEAAGDAALEAAGRVTTADSRASVLGGERPAREHAGTYAGTYADAYPGTNAGTYASAYAGAYSGGYADNTARLAADLFDGAVAAGASADKLAARRAEAAALVGDLDAALRLADHTLSELPEAESADRALAAAVAATVLAHRGMLADSAALARAADAASPAPSGAAVTALLGVGDLDAAERELHALDHTPAGASALRHTVGSLIAHGLHHTVTGPALVGLSELVQATRLLGARAHTALLPESPATLAALVALHLGEPDVAARTIGRALASQPPWAIGSVRCRLLHGWIALLRGELTTVDSVLAELSGYPGPLEPRDELHAAALAVGAARRRTDLPSLLATWPRAREAVLAHPVDLYVLQPLGEIAVAAARLHEDHLLAGQLQQAEDMLERLGHPAVWGAVLHWYGLHAAIAAESPVRAGHHARAMAGLANSAEAGRCAAVLSRAASSWLRVLAGEVDVELVTAAARGIQSVGLAWDAARLAGQAAIRTTDRKDMAILLGFARALHDEAQASAAPERRPSDTPEQDLVTLSNRELEVAALLVEGMTYKQIGERLFISAKTVEHHIARIRHRLGDPGRPELLARLRTMIGQPAGKP